MNANPISLELAQTLADCFLTPAEKGKKLRVKPVHVEWNVNPGEAFAFEEGMDYEIVLCSVQKNGGKTKRGKTRVLRWVLYYFINHYSRDSGPEVQEVEVGDYGTFSEALDHMIGHDFKIRNEGRRENAWMIEQGINHA